MEATSESFFKETLKTMLELACGKQLNMPSDCQNVVDGIWNKLHEQVSINTIKRLTGFLPYEHAHRRSTLDIIARYLDYANWSALTTVLQNANSGFDRHAGTILANNLKCGDRVSLTYLPDRELVLTCQGGSRFLVDVSVNSKLMAGDIVHVAAFALHYPLLVSNVIRQGRSIGEYTAGIVGGITSIQVSTNKGPRQ